MNRDEKIEKFFPHNRDQKVSYFNQYTGQNEKFSIKSNSLVSIGIYDALSVLSEKTCQHLKDMIENFTDKITIVDENFRKDALGCVAPKYDKAEDGKSLSLRYDVNLAIRNTKGLDLSVQGNPALNVRHNLLVITHEFLHLASSKTNACKKTNGDWEYGVGFLFRSKDIVGGHGHFINEEAINLLANQANEFNRVNGREMIDCFNDTTMEEKMGWNSNYVFNHNLGRLLVCAFDNSYGTKSLKDLVESGEGVDAVDEKGKPINTLYYSMFQDSSLIEKEWNKYMSDTVNFEDFCILSDELLKPESSFNKKVVAHATIKAVANFVNRKMRDKNGEASYEDQLNYISNFNKLFNDCCKGYNTYFTREEVKGE